jgi:two-component system chemotaxis response regulator CheB
MREHPLPVVMVSSLTERGAEVTLDALAAGAVAFVTKPSMGSGTKLADLIPHLAEVIRAAASAKVYRRGEPPAKKVLASSALAKTTHRILAIGASTGGTEAIREVLQELPADAPGVVVAQHMPEHFTTSWAKRCDGLCSVRVQEARDDDRVLPGHVLIAPGNYHMRLERRGGNYHVRVSQDELVNRHRPSVDVLFHSVAEHAGKNAVGAILTGMGADGVKGLLAMRQAGAHTLAQDEATCVVFGMPKEAIAAGAAKEVLPLGKIAARVLALSQEGA